MNKSLFIGWDFDTWSRAFKWAGEPMTHAPMVGLTSQELEPFLKVRRKWLERGGPTSGPISNLFNRA